MSPRNVAVHEVAGIGFGPANLALAIALAEHEHRMSARFFERQPEFGWHRGMLIEGATMQVSFLKDLATPREPTSRYGFLSYLHDRGRLADFINHRSFYPSRVEFHDYLEWAAAQFASIVDYGTPVEQVRPVLDRGEVVALEVLADGRVRCRARNVVIALGLEPVLPSGVESSTRVWHSSELLTQVEVMRSAQPRRIVVAGSGQSAAEVVAYLHDQFTDAEICSVFPRYGYSPADDSPFVNRIFDPAAVDQFYDAPPSTREQLLRYHANTNYSVVDHELIDELYRRSYQESVTGRRRLRVLNMARVAGVSPSADGVRVRLDQLVDGSTQVLDADFVVYATGYRSADPQRLLADIVPGCKMDAAGRLRVGRDHRVLTAESVRCGIYVQGATEATHGLASTLLSTVAVRAGQIADSIAGAMAGTRRTGERTEDHAANR